MTLTDWLAAHPRLVATWPARTTNESLRWQLGETIRLAGGLWSVDDVTDNVTDDVTAASAPNSLSAFAGVVTGMTRPVPSGAGWSSVATGGAW